jgi:hypothetical protein
MYGESSSQERYRWPESSIGETAEPVHGLERSVRAHQRRHGFPEQVVRRRHDLDAVHERVVQGLGRGERDVKAAGAGADVEGELADEVGGGAERSGTR